MTGGMFYPHAYSRYSRFLLHDIHNTYQLVHLQEVRERYPSHDGEYRDYMSTFDAEQL